MREKVRKMIISFTFFVDKLKNKFKGEQEKVPEIEEEEIVIPNRDEIYQRVMEIKKQRSDEIERNLRKELSETLGELQKQYNEYRLKKKKRKNIKQDFIP